MCSTANPALRRPPGPPSARRSRGDAQNLSNELPSLTTIRQRVDVMGRTVIGLLADQIADQIDEQAVAPDELLFEPDLVVRSSTGPLAGGSAQSPRY